MKKYYIEEVKCGITDGGMACGPCDGSVITGIKFNDGEHKKSKWIWNDQYMDFPYFIITDEDIFDKLMSNYDDSDPFFDYRENHFIPEFDGIDVNGELEEVKENIRNSRKKSAKLLKLLLYVSNEIISDEEFASFNNKYLDDISFIDITLEEEEIDF